MEGIRAAGRGRRDRRCRVWFRRRMGTAEASLGSPSARSQRRLFSKARAQDAGQPISSSPCERGWGWPQSTQGRNRKLLAPRSRSKGQAQSRARLRSQFCSQLKGTSTLPLRHLGVGAGGWGAGISSQFSLAQHRSAPFLLGSPLPAPVLSPQKSTAGPT